MQRGTTMNNTDKKLKIKPNPNQQTFQEISQAVLDNHGYCCCAIQNTEDMKCPCEPFREQDTNGFCHCGRYFKIREYPIITILADPAHAEEANDMADSLTSQGFVVLTPRFGNENQYVAKKAIFDDIQRSQIYMADLVFVMNSNAEAIDFLENEIYWAEELQKKIVYQYTEEVKENEV